MRRIMTPGLYAGIALAAMAGAGPVITIDGPETPSHKRKRDMDIEGPPPELGPPQNPTPTRQMRRKAERMAKKAKRT